MKLIELVDARDSLQKLVQQDLPIRKAYEVMQLTEEANRHLLFYSQELAKLGDDPDPEAVKELDGFEIAGPERIRIEMAGGLRLSAADVALLLPLIDFAMPAD